MVYRTQAQRPPHAQPAIASPKRVALTPLATPRVLLPAFFGALALACARSALTSRRHEAAIGFGITAVAYLVSAACAHHLWARSLPQAGRERLLCDHGKQWLWSVWLAVPLIGPLFYGAVYEPLPPGEAPNRSTRWWLVG